MSQITTTPSTSSKTMEPNVVRPWSGSAQITLALLVLCASGLLLWNYLESTSSRAAPTLLYRDQKIDLNTADRSRLVLLPEVGPTLADRIEKYRAENGSFERVDDLLKITGIGEKKLARIRPWVYVTPPVEKNDATECAPPEKVEPPRWQAKTKKQIDITEPINVNKANAKELQRLPGIGPVLSSRIIAWRDTAPFTFVDDLVKVKGIGPKTLAKIRPYVTVGD